MIPPFSFLSPRPTNVLISGLLPVSFFTLSLRVNRSSRTFSWSSRPQKPPPAFFYAPATIRIIGLPFPISYPGPLVRGDYLAVPGPVQMHGIEPRRFLFSCVPFSLLPRLDWFDSFISPLPFLFSREINDYPPCVRKSVRS